MFSREGWANRRPANTRLTAAPVVRATPVMPAATDHSSGRTIARKCAGNGSRHPHGKEAVRRLWPDRPRTRDSSEHECLHPARFPSRLRANGLRLQVMRREKAGKSWTNGLAESDELWRPGATEF
jgi:hypothetical protein